MSEAKKKTPKSNKNKKAKPKVTVFKSKKKQGDPESALIEKLKSDYENIDSDNIKSFTDLPLSPLTLKGLKKCGYLKPTEIQRETIRLSLIGNDILGAAQTGSGKTLAFLIPILERLFCERWTRLDGTGALVITPTRELAYQIFEALRKVGEFHDFSAGLIIGGKDLKFERNRMDQCNIIICTPGRLLQHMDENPLLDCVNMKILVLDEADRCLDLGFEQTMNAIIANLPPTRQTLLFSATQTKSVKDLARLSLKDPSFVSVHEHSDTTTPKELQQSYVVCELKDKISILWSFIKNHLKQKVIVFLASCKEVKYVYEIFCKLRPGTSLLALYGTLHQLKRMEIYESFGRKSSAVLFATDIAARGLDFPEVHWVVQADCPEDTDTYIHRVGRTARYHRGGESLLLLLPSEVQMVEDLKNRKIPINPIEINPQKLFNPAKKLEAYLVKDSTLKDTAQRAFVSYAKSVFLMKNKNIFDVQSLDTDSFAYSLGLIKPPRIRFLERLNAKTNPNNPSRNKTVFKYSDEEETAESLPEKSATSIAKSAFHVPDDSDDDDQIKMTNKVAADDSLINAKNVVMDVKVGKNNKKKPVTKAAVVKKILKQRIAPNKKIVFDEEGDALFGDKKSELAREYENADEGGLDIEQAKLVLKEEDKLDKQVFKEKVKAKHKEEKRKLKEQKSRENGEEEADEFGESESEEEPDLSWLPDPDKIYGKLRKEDDESESEPPEEILEPVKKSKKRKLIKPDKVSKESKKLKQLSSTLNVNEAEELAMMLLKNK